MSCSSGLQLLLSRRKLHAGAAKRLAKELRDYQREPSSFLIEPVEDRRIYHARVYSVSLWDMQKLVSFLQLPVQEGSGL